MSAKEASSVGVGSADLDWPNLGFQYRETNGHMKMTWKDGSWSAAELVEQSTVTMHVGATALHYGQSVFEGLKAFAQEDGKVPATFDIIHFAGWAPHPDQPRPKRPGSANARLADALGVAERGAGDKAG